MFQAKLYTLTTLYPQCFDSTCHYFYYFRGGVTRQEAIGVDLFSEYHFLIYHLSDEHIGKPMTSDPTSIGKILHQPHVHSYSFQADDCKCTKITCTYSKCIYLLLKEMATSWSIWLYGAIIILYFSRLTC